MPHKMRMAHKKCLSAERHFKFKEDSSLSAGYFTSLHALSANVDLLYATVHNSADLLDIRTKNAVSDTM